MLQDIREFESHTFRQIAASNVHRTTCYRMHTHPLSGQRCLRSSWRAPLHSRQPSLRRVRRNAGIGTGLGLLGHPGKLPTANVLVQAQEARGAHGMATIARVQEERPRMHMQP